MPIARHRPLILGATAALTVLGAGVYTITAASAATGCRVDYSITNSWQGGFGANVNITNLGDPLTSWRLTWSFGAGQQITQAWNATVTSSGSQFTATNVSYNGSLGTGASTAFGFNGTSGSTNPEPESFSLNGTVCTGAVGATTGPPTGGPPTGGPPTGGPPTGGPPTGGPPTGGPTGGPTTGPPPQPGSGKQVEDLNRGLISVRSGSGNLVSWRLLGTEAPNTGFNVYRAGTRLTATPITNSTNYLDNGAAADASYTVRAVVNGTEQAASEASLRFTGGNYLDVPISSPGSSYSANDASVGDMDGDGQLEIVLKWDPSNSRDNSQAGVTSNVFVDAYRLNGTRLWRIDLGPNIRAGAHYTQFQVYDYEGDGRAEVVMKTGDGSRSGTGQLIGTTAVHRNANGFILTGPEYLTAFDGLTGAVRSTVAFEPARGNHSSWGDSNGNRVDRFLAGTAYLDGQRPSIIMGRGYYAKTMVAAYDFRNGALTRRWLFDSTASGNSAYGGKGNHQLSVADVDADGRDEIIYGSMTLDDNGRGLYAGAGHGDALHVSDFVPSRAGQEVWAIHESGNAVSATLRDARNGQIVFQRPNNGGAEGPGRGVAADIYAGNPGGEFWGAGTNMSGLYNSAGQSVGRQPSSANHLAWWDADTTRELVDATRVDKYGTGGETRLLTAAGVATGNGTKSNPALSGDLLGDWREEIIWRTSNNSALRIFSTPTPTTTRLYTLLHDPQYRVAIAWQNTSYNQPPHPSYFIGSGMGAITRPNVYVR
ncbi:MAG TPA: cellulose binding domain-containing protein [Pilimelia sp.]|nr:cellulose binding domain-containing protein [Pilimelia sp.]